MHFRARSILIGLCILSSIQLISVGQDAVAMREQARRNIGLFLAKVNAGKVVNVAFLGSSATAGIGATDRNKTSYRALVMNGLRTQYPKNKFNELNAAVAHTDAAYAAIRVRRDLVEHKPDLVFVEFSNADQNQQQEAVMRAMEGIVRQLLAVSEPPEIVFLYPPTITSNPAVQWQEMIANYYRLPAINSIPESAPTLFVKDGSALNDQGHAMFAKMILDFVAEQAKLRPSPHLRVLPGYFISEDLTYGELKAFAELPRPALWKLESTSDPALPAALLISDKPSAEITFSFEGTVIGITYRTGADGGTIECLLDGKPAPQPLANIDTYDKDPHIGTKIVTGEIPPGEHKLTIRVKASKNPKSSGNVIRLGSLLIGGARPERL